MSAASFSPDYLTARARFRSGALALGCALEDHPLGVDGPDGAPLTVDVAWLGSRRPARAVVVSSGLHGVEGFFGSAVQAALLEGALTGYRPPTDTALVLVHALNPYGFAFLRRVNEDNVDLNRNFLRPGEPYSGSPAGYAALDGLLNPKTPESLGDRLMFLPSAAAQILRHGMPALKNAVAGGQYDFPAGLFFGGQRASRTVHILREALPRWFVEATRVVHIDLHTGLGKRGAYRLFADHADGSNEIAALGSAFDGLVEPWQAGSTSYTIRGGMGTWAKALLPGCDYDVLAAEFGTESVLDVIAALRAENRAYHHDAPDAPAARKARERLRDVFAPPDPRWRARVVPAGVTIVRQALEAAGMPS